MTISKDLKDVKFERGSSLDSQFQVWRISSISESRNFSLAGDKGRKEPMQMTDADLDEISFPASSISRKRRDLQMSTKQTKILATLLPDAIMNITDLSKNNPETFVGVLLFGDISGFTSLCEKYNGFGKSGSDKLTVTLNSYLGPIVEMIYKHGGDVLKFSGDAFLALWKLQNFEYMYTLIHRVVCCALLIQNNLGTLETDVKILLKVKLAISAGNIAFSVIGDDVSRHYVVVGSPVQEVKAAEKACSSGEVTLSFSAWGHLCSVNYEYQWKDDYNVKINRIIYNPSNMKREVFRPQGIPVAENTEPHLEPSKGKEIFKKAGYANTSGEIRSLVDEVTKRNLSSDLRSFLIPSVIQQIDADLPMEYLSEMRTITIMFINIVPDRLNSKCLINMVDKVYVIICSLVYKAMGTVNKVSLFDKDVMLLVIFGLRGFNHEGEVAACLKCGYDIRQACCSMEGVHSISVGITTGEAYCGVVGHPLRREYTVIGPAVNMAARIMIAYPGMVTCDQRTFLFSNLAANFFTIQEKKFLKGIANTGPIYEFTLEKKKNTLAAMQDGMYPILGRDKEIQVFQNMLQAFGSQKTWDRAILVRGPARIGKTRLLDEMIVRSHKKGFSPIVIALQNIHSTQPYGAAQYVIKQILGIPDGATVEDKEKRLSSLLKNHVPLNYFCCINEVMNVNFPNYSDTAFFGTAQKLEKIKSIFNIILVAATKSVILAIDDIECCDYYSWELITNVINKGIKFLIMTMPYKTRSVYPKYLKFSEETESRLVKLTLSGIPNHLLGTLACQIMNVRAVPVELVRLLKSRSNGNPGWCESFLLTLAQSNTIKVEELPEWYLKRSSYIVPPESDLKRIKYAANPEQSFKALKEEKHVEVNEESEINSLKEKLPSQKKLKHKLKFSAFRRKKSDFDNIMNQGNVHASSVQIEVAYEDLKERIMLARCQPNLPAEQGKKDDEVTPAFEMYDEMRSPVDFSSSKEKILSRSTSRIDIHEESKLPNRAMYTGIPSTSKPVLETSDSDSNESLKNKLIEIFRRYTYRRRSTVWSVMKNSVQYQNLNVTKSLEYICEDPEVHSMRQSKSAEAVLTTTTEGKEKSQPEGFMTGERVSFVKYGFTEFSPCTLWRSHTEDIFEESIEIFLQNKAKGTDSRTTNFLNDKKTTSLDIGSDQSNASSGINIPSHPYSSYDSVYQGSQVYERPFKPPSKSDYPAMKKALSQYISETEEDDSTEPAHPARSSISLDISEQKSTSRSRLDVYEQRESTPENSKQKKKFCWRLFGCCKRRSSDISDAETFIDFSNDENVDSTNTLPGITINPKIKLEDLSTPELFVGTIMSAFDCLSPYEQLMLKCGSIIGDMFTRKMLNAIMHDPDPLLTSEAVKKLFEMQILSCGAEVDLRSQTNDSRCLCLCILTSNDIVDHSLPRYAFCRLLLFKYALFRSTLYELIPLDQKREFHIRSVEYLEKESVKCASCGRIFGTPEKKHSKSFQLRKSNPIYQKILEKPKKKKKKIIDSLQEDLREETQKKNDTTLVQIPNILPSFVKCECLTLEADALKQLIRHSVSAGLIEKEVKFLIKYSGVLITLGEFLEAKEKLTEAKEQIKSLSVEAISIGERRLIMGKIHMLLGQCHLEIGTLKRANAHLYAALKYFGSNFIPVRGIWRLQMFYEFTVQSLYQRRSFTTPYNADCENPEDCPAICLSLLSNIFMIQGKWDMAKLVAMQGLNILQSNCTNPIELCNAYSNAIDVYRHFGEFKYCRKLETAASKNSSHIFKFDTLLQMIALGRLSCSALNARLISGHLSQASILGDKAFKICQSIPYNYAESYIISKVVNALIMIGKISRAASLILLLPPEDIWRYVLSLDFIMETGLMIESSSLCLEEIEKVINSDTSLHPPLRRRAVSTIYLWMRRIGDTEKADFWRRKLSQNIVIPLPGDTYDNMVSVLKIIEGDLLDFASLKTYPTHKTKPEKRMLLILKSLDKTSKRAKVIRPRLLHLTAYYQFLLRDLDKALGLLKETKELSMTQENLLERMWVAHNEKVWRNSYDFDKDYWVKSAKAGTLKKWMDVRDVSEWRNDLYTLSFVDS